MAGITLAFMACDAHELACHFVARHAGLYKRYGIEPRLADGNFPIGEKAGEAVFRMACGAALVTWLQGGDVRVVLVAAQRPMFWLYGAPSLLDPDGCRGAVVAAYPEAAPPAMLLRVLLTSRGLPISAIGFLPGRDDAARLGLLRDSSASAALISSAIPPAAMARLGYRPLLCLGDNLRVATTGIAVDPALCTREPALVSALCACYQDALSLIHADPELAVRALDAAGMPLAGSAGELLPDLQACYTVDGRSPVTLLQADTAALANVAGIVRPRPLDDLYDYSFLV